jgi:hypothetical protein
MMVEWSGLSDREEEEVKDDAPAPVEAANAENQPEDGALRGPAAPPRSRGRYRGYWYVDHLSGAAYRRTSD